jgi:hypothetical protein
MLSLVHIGHMVSEEKFKCTKLTMDNDHRVMEKDHPDF